MRDMHQQQQASLLLLARRHLLLLDLLPLQLPLLPHGSLLLQVALPLPRR